jgi:hypothetical protein
MARIAGMALEHRWGWWDRSPFTGERGLHVSVWRLPENMTDGHRTPGLCAVFGSRQNGQRGMGPAEAATARW